MRHPLVGNGRRDDRHRELCSEDGRRRRHLADVDKHARAEPPVIERLDVASDRVLVAGAACEVPERGLVQRLLGDPFVVPHVERFLGSLHLRRVWAFVSDLPQYPQDAADREATAPAPGVGRDFASWGSRVAAYLAMLVLPFVYFTVLHGNERG